MTDLSVKVELICRMYHNYPAIREDTRPVAAVDCPTTCLEDAIKMLVMTSIRYADVANFLDSFHEIKKTKETSYNVTY